MALRDHTSVRRYGMAAIAAAQRAPALATAGRVAAPLGVAYTLAGCGEEIPGNFGR